MPESDDTLNFARYEEKSLKTVGGYRVSTTSEGSGVWG
jgi:hypothetical protein